MYSLREGKKWKGVYRLRAARLSSPGLKTGAFRRDLVNDSGNKGKRHFFSLPNVHHEIVKEIGVHVCPPSVVLSREEELLSCLLIAQPMVLETKLR
jgi:hypothetical protein